MMAKATKPEEGRKASCAGFNKQDRRELTDYFWMVKSGAAWPTTGAIPALLAAWLALNSRTKSKSSSDAERSVVTTDRHTT